MIITDLYLSNFRKHRKLHLKLKPGVTGIVGKNYAGKSTIVEGLLFALTGSLFSGNKKSAITLGEDTGYVILDFILNNKKGRIQRHLDVTKTILQYDNVTHKKAADVSALWDNLLQISNEIVERVIIAQQGQINLLFSGDQAIREKIFQKIFLVPNTEKIRKVIWDKYLKQVPPVVPVENILQLKEKEDYLIKELELLRKELLINEPLTEQKVDQLKARIAFIARCQTDINKKNEYADRIKVMAENLTAAEVQIKDIADKLKYGDLPAFEKSRNVLLQQQALFKQKQELIASLEKAITPFAPTEIDALIQKKQQLEVENTKLHERAITLAAERKQRQKELESMQIGEICPTCKQATHITTEMLSAAQEAVEDITRELTNTNRSRVTMGAEIDNTTKLIDYYNSSFLHRRQIEDQLKQFENLTFDAQELKDINEAIELITTLNKEKQALLLTQMELKGRLSNLTQAYNNLAIYDGKDSEVELKELNMKLNANNVRSKIYQQKSISIKVKEAELFSLRNKITETNDNIERNKKINKYVDTLNKLYDMFHSSQFPRLLILKYANLVTEYLQENLDNFNFPYRAQISDNFSIDLSDDQGRVLPRVSGGQEIQIGISLHLALHDLFGQSFPLMIIDEGTTHLDTDNRKAYFEIIRGLKAKNKLKQILIIDHDPDLIQVVDQIIEL